MNLAQVAIDEIESIVDEWVEFARGKEVASQAMTPEQLADHAKLLLLAIVADVGSSREAGAPHDKSTGTSADSSPDITRTARKHAAQRFQQGFSLPQLVSEFRALRASVIRRWAGQLPPVRAEDLDELTRFGEAMDQALSESTSLYSRKVDDSRNLLLGVLGHDLRTPLGVIHMSASYLLRTDTLDGAQTKSVARILTSAERMTGMVRDILEFTRTALGETLPLMTAPADLGEIARQIVAEVATVHPEARIDLACEGTITGHWDAARVGQMLANLVANAVQHGAAQPVSVTVTGADTAVTVQVHNKGAPIPAEAQQNLFVPLRQTAGGARERRAGSSGLGLGLYITREIAVAHGGSVTVRSDDEGTTFSVRLPRTPPSREGGGGA
ncbi:HAMP domain-containing histidine kinase [Ramlibacter sp. G-1-2-2]|uniref:histidine kinase n=1 Tax=Ramlibacter agri TaxID=2728837 RepID=A0A848HE05_9BURK|nr:HAMP domain-containing sensor histidine kinase [Ramlibacter agri]NML48617.1 HAMP domain-containing histidine kinase [Ramlibacter agri]